MKILFVLLSTLFLLVPLVSHAVDAPVGSIKTVKGTASIVRGNAAVETKSGTRVFRNDTLRTGSDGALSMVFRDDTLLSIGPGSELHVNEFVFSPGEGKMSIVTRLLKGSAVYLSGIIARLSPESVRFETPVANIGIRGTMFAVKVEDPEVN